MNLAANSHIKIYVQAPFRDCLESAKAWQCRQNGFTRLYSERLLQAPRLHGGLRRGKTHLPRDTAGVRFTAGTLQSSPPAKRKELFGLPPFVVQM